MMNGLLDSALFTAVVDAAVRGTFILLAALAGTSLMRRTSAAARHLVWLAALTALLLLPVARGFVPEWRVLPAAPVFAAPAAPAAPPVSAPLVSPVPSTVPASQAGTSAGGTAESAPAPVRMPVDWKTLALLAWAAGAALLALRLAYGVLRVRWIERRAVELTDDGWVRLTDGLARRLGLGRIVRLLREPGATVPMTWGIFRPVILLPGEADGWGDERRRVVLAHELAHVRRWDALTQWIAHLALAVYWFNPLVWVAVRKLREEREHACDDAVLEIGTRPADYADHLLTIVRSLGSSHGTAAAALAMARRSQFEGRLLAILDSAVRRNGVSRAAGLATAAAALACLVPLAALRPAEGAAPVRESASIPSAQPSASPSAAATMDGAGRDAGTPVQRQAGEGDGRPRGTETPVRDALAALGAERDTLDAGRSVSRLTAGQPGPVATTVLMTALEEEGDPGLYAEIIRSALEIRSATERRLVLVRVLEQSDVSAENVVAIVAATRTMPSDSERRIVINRALEHSAFPQGGRVMDVLTESLAGFSSASEQRIVISALFERRRLDTASLAAILRLVPRMENETERRLVLVRAAERQRVEGPAREAYLAAARSIRNETERGIVLSALVEPDRRRTSAAPRPASSTHAGREPRSGEGLWSSDHEVQGTRDGRPRYVRVRVRDAIFAGERWNVRSFRTGGMLFVEERLDGRTRRVEASCDGAGNPVWRYTVDGQARAFDASARRWMESIIRESSS